MKKNIYYLLLILFQSTLITACEVEMAAPTPDSNDNLISLTALAVGGEKLSVRLSRNQDPNKASFDKFDDQYIMWRYLKFNFIKYDESDPSHQETYYDGNLITDADVTATVNGQTYRLTYNSETLNFESDNYIAKTGDRISLTATGQIKQNDNTYREFKSYAAVTIPDTNFNVELLGTEKIYREKSMNEDGFREIGIDSAVVFKLRLNSSPGMNFYRLKITSISYIFNYDKYLQDIQGNEYKYNPFYDGFSLIYPIDAFYSNDPLLYDANLGKNFGPWPAYMTDVFTDENFFEDKYVIEVTSRIADVRGDCVNYGRYFEIELQPITRNLMEYISAIYRLRIKEDSYFSQPISISSNIEGGTGIFGAIGKSKKIRYFLPGEENSSIPPVE
ncbi:MAG: DUF4249 domain-containing protein [Muribaculaceae bacterium]|nr:DUF4249 domain-containing protein [Muribaculaceae bacterium]